MLVVEEILEKTNSPSLPRQVEKLRVRKGREGTQKEWQDKSLGFHLQACALTQGLARELCAAFLLALPVPTFTAR